MFAPIGHAVAHGEVPDLPPNDGQHPVLDIGAAGVQRLVARQQLGPVTCEVLEEVLAGPGPQVEDVGPDRRGTGIAGGAYDRRPSGAGRPTGPGRIGAIPTLASMPASTSARTARRRWRGGAVPGSVRRQISGSIVGMLNVTPTFARSEAADRTSTSRTISGPRVIRLNGVRASPSATIAPRVRRNRPSAGWYGSVAVPTATLLATPRPAAPARGGAPRRGWS